MEVHNYAVVFENDGRIDVRLFSSKTLATDLYYKLKGRGRMCYLYTLSLVNY